MDKKLSILIVEDDLAACKEFVDYLEEADDILLIGVTNNSTKALDYVQDYLPDAIILDLELHNGSGNGLTMMQELKLLHLATLPYILITTNNSSQITYESARQSGADFIMAKYQEDYSAENVITFLRMMKTVIHGRRLSASPRPDITESPKNTTKRVVKKIHEELNYVGISPKLIGYQYLTEAIQLAIQKKPYLCTEIGQKYGKTDASVERAMQNAINKAWRTSDIDDLLKYYTAKINSEKGVPTITEFIYYYANKIKNEIDINE